MCPERVEGFWCQQYCWTYKRWCDSSQDENRKTNKGFAGVQKEMDIGKQDT